MLIEPIEMEVRNLTEREQEILYQLETARLNKTAIRKKKAIRAAIRSCRIFTGGVLAMVAVVVLTAWSRLLDTPFPQLTLGSIGKAIYLPIIFCVMFYYAYKIAFGAAPKQESDYDATRRLIKEAKLLAQNPKIEIR